MVFGSSIPSSTKINKNSNKTTKKNVVKVGPRITKLSGSAYVPVPLPNSQEPSHTYSADRGSLETYLLSTVMSIIRKAGKPPPPSIANIPTAELLFILNTVCPAKKIRRKRKIPNEVVDALCDVILSFLKRRYCQRHFSLYYCDKIKSSKPACRLLFL